MSHSVLPEPEQVAGLVPSPDGVLWRYGGDVRLLATAGFALVLQVAHPTVGAGVRDHSNFASDPWGRLLRTLDYVYVMSYGGADAAAATGGRLREMHKAIRGTTPDGHRYHALEPEAFAWVHATLLEGIVVGHRRFGRPLRAEQVERLYAEWRALGRVIGVRERDLPPDWPGFRRYFAEMVELRLADNETVREVVSTLTRPAAPPIPLMADGLWRALRLPMARLGALATVGLLPPTLRERLGQPWTARQDRELRALGAMSRAATPLMPARLRNIGPTYLRWRSRELGRGEGSVAVSPRVAAAA